MTPQDQAIEICFKWFSVIGHGLDVDLHSSDYAPAMHDEMAAEYDADMETLHSLDIECVYEEQLEALAKWENLHGHQMPMIMKIKQS